MRVMCFNDLVSIRMSRLLNLIKSCPIEVMLFIDFYNVSFQGISHSYIPW